MLPIGVTAVSKVYEQAYKQELAKIEADKLAALAAIEQAAIAQRQQQEQQAQLEAEQIIVEAMEISARGKKPLATLKEAAHTRHKALTDAGYNVIFYYKHARKCYKLGHSKYLRHAELLKQVKYSLQPTIVLCYDDLSDVTGKVVALALTETLKTQIRLASVNELLTFIKKFDNISAYVAKGL